MQKCKNVMFLYCKEFKLTISFVPPDANGHFSVASLPICCALHLNISASLAGPLLEGDLIEVVCLKWSPFSLCSLGRSYFPVYSGAKIALKFLLKICKTCAYFLRPSDSFPLPLSCLTRRGMCS